jgi:hypothetical protein
MSPQRVAAMLPVAAASAPLVNWASLGEVLLLALATAVVIVGGYSVGLTTLDAYLSSVHERDAATGGPAASTVQVKHDSLVVALLSFGVCVAGVGVGLWAMLVR